MLFIRGKERQPHGLSLLRIDTGLDRAGGCQQTDAGFLEAGRDIFKSRLLHIDKRHLEVALHIRKERVSGIAGNDDRVTAILFETLG